VRAERARPSATSPRAQRRGQEILDAAAEVFSRKGYAAANVEDVADIVGMLKGSLYYYFDSKEDLLYRLIQTIHGQAAQTLVECSSFEGTPVERLDAFVRLHLRRLTTNLAYTRVFYTEFAHLNGDRYAEIIAERKTYEVFLRGLIVAGQGERLFCRERDARLSMIAILTLLNSVHLWFRPTGPTTVEKLADEYSAFTIAALRCDGDRPCACDGSPARPKLVAVMDRSET
jgi:TetR/AcrR family transcriptional regulator, cholesterol catabolism regulator